MRAVELILALVVAGAVAWGGFLAADAVARRRDNRQLEQARWRMTHHGSGGETVVAVSLVRPDGRVLDRREVARFPDQAPDWEARFLAATAVAEERAFHLNAAGGPPAQR